MVLRYSRSDRSDSLESLAMGRRVSCGICVSDISRDRVDSAAIQWSALPTRTLLVVEAMEGSEESDSHKCDYVHTGWSVSRENVEMAWAGICRRIECGNRSITADHEQRAL